MRLQCYSSPRRVNELRNYSLSKRMLITWIPLVDVKAENALVYVDASTTFEGIAGPEGSDEVGSGHVSMASMGA